MKIYQFLFGIITGILICLLWLNEPEVLPDPDIVQYKRQFIEAMHERFEGKILALEKDNDSLRDKLQQNRFELTESKKRAKNARNKLVHQVEKLKEDSICKAKGDSLETVVLEVFRNIDSTEAFYEHRLSLLENVVAVRDSEIAICTNSYTELKGILEQQVLREQQLTKNLETALKSQRKKIREHKLLAGGMLFLSGVATVLYINSRE